MDEWRLIGCKVFEHILRDHLSPDELDHLTILDYGLHRFPDQLRKRIQEEVDQIQTPTLILLAYGLCGNSLNGLKSRKHTLVIPLAHDCITIFLGSREAYQREFQSHPGTYYLTRGWLESGSDPFREFIEYQSKYGEEQAQWIMDQQYANYNRLVLVGNNQDELDLYREVALEVADYCQRWEMHYEEILGTDSYIRQLLKLRHDPSAVPKSFLLIPPGGEINLQAFLED
jgi:hypothetical protein